MDKKILIIGSCTSLKKYHPNNIAKAEDLDYPIKRKQKELQHKDFVLPAYKMYTGKQHTLTVKAFNKLKKRGKDVDFWIISAGYGLIRHDIPIIPYQVTFSKMGKKKIIERGKKLNIPSDFNHLVKEFDTVIVLLGKEYLLSLNFPRPIDKTTRFIALGGKDVEKLLPNQDNITFIKAGNEEAKTYKAASIYLKGVILNEMIDNNQI